MCCLFVGVSLRGVCLQSKRRIVRYTHSTAACVRLPMVHQRRPAGEQQAVPMCQWQDRHIVCSRHRQRHALPTLSDADLCGPKLSSLLELIPREDARRLPLGSCCVPVAQVLGGEIEHPPSELPNGETAVTSHGQQPPEHLINNAELLFLQNPPPRRIVCRLDKNATIEPSTKPSRARNATCTSW